MYCKNIFLIAGVFFFLNGCIPSNTYEKNETIANHRWHKKDVKTYQFNINDTTSRYLMFLTLRHTDAYEFNNIWVDVETIKPNGKLTKQKVELPLAEAKGRWTGKGMNEIYEHQIRLSGNTTTRFDQLGPYTVKLHQIMRQNPLLAVMSIGIRLERIPSSQ